MKWSRYWLIKPENEQFDFDETLTFSDEMFYNLSRINGLKDVRVTGHGHYFDGEGRLYVDVHIEGTMIVPCAISLEDTDYPFAIDETEIFINNKIFQCFKVHYIIPPLTQMFNNAIIIDTKK